MANIIFKTVTYKNLLSTGNSPSTIFLNKSKTTLISGTNGMGKSTILDAITFSLFGKPFRDIKIGQLVNSINGKHCLVTTEFDIGINQYKVIRGLKPAVFEIYENGIMLNQDAAVKDYQKILEQQILRLNHKTFCQVVILGAASFVPFMQLKAAQRREVVEDILDIRIFTVMNQILRDKISSTKDEIKKIESDIQLARHKVDSQSAIIKTLTSAKTDTVNSILKKIEDNSSIIDESQNQSDLLLNEIIVLKESIKDKPELDGHIQQVSTLITKHSANREHHEKHIHFFNANDVCVTCSQEINEDYKKKVIVDLSGKITDNEDKITALEIAARNLKESLDRMHLIINDITDKNIKLSTINSTISLLFNQNKQLRYDIETTKKDTGCVDIEKQKLKDLATNAMNQIGIKNTLSEERDLQDVASLLLKDTGIKTAIIREYLPVMNQLINHYLNLFDLYIQFNLDENFNETLKSRHRDEFTYSSFSEGEKKKVDLSILFAWRQVAKLKNSVNTNLLIFDEIMDASLDSSSIDMFMTMLNDLGEDTNVFVISHRGDVLNDKFHSVLQIEKRNDFSVIV